MLSEKWCSQVPLVIVPECNQFVVQNCAVLCPTWLVSVFISLYASCAYFQIPCEVIDRVKAEVSTEVY